MARGWFVCSDYARKFACGDRSFRHNSKSCKFCRQCLAIRTFDFCIIMVARCRDCNCWIWKDSADIRYCFRPPRSSYPDGSGRFRGGWMGGMGGNRCVHCLRSEFQDCGCSCFGGHVWGGFQLTGNLFHRRNSMDGIQPRRLDC